MTAEPGSGYGYGDTLSGGVMGIDFTLALSQREREPGTQLWEGSPFQNPIPLVAVWPG